MVLSDGTLFVTYSDYSIGQQILIWATGGGTILNEDSVGMNLISFVYAEGTRAMLLEFNPHNVDTLTVIEANLHPFEPDGTPLPVEQIYVDTLAADVYSSGSSYDYTNGELKLLVATVRPAESPVEYRLRLIRHTPGSTIVHDAFDPGPLPVQHFASYWTIATGPWNMSVVGFVVAQLNVEQQVWVEGLDENGQSSGLVHIIQMPDNEAANGVALLVNAGTVYACYTIVPLPGGPNGGAFLTGFPLDEILAAEDDFIPQPNSFTLSAYPNPFNPTTTISFSLPSAGFVELIVYDLTGREVSTLLSGMKNAGQHNVVWNANGLPSGIYFARMQTGDVTQVRKLVLMK